MMDPAVQIKNEIGVLQYIALRKLLAAIQIAIDAEEQNVTVYRDGREPLRISFHDLEKFINASH
jgi:hypothetical protein